jgi:very-short-patch-repair endonuclease
MREMNEIERKFYDAFCDYYGLKGFNDDDEALLKVAETKGIVFNDLQAQFPIDLSIVDFYFEIELPFSTISFAVEIDGHEYHKTKEQRYHDYVRERKLQAKGIIVVRFTASEVFVNAESCVEELDKIMKKFNDDEDKIQVEHLQLLFNK